MIVLEIMEPKKYETEREREVRGRLCDLQALTSLSTAKETDKTCIHMREL